MKLDQIWEKVKNKDYSIQLKLATSAAALVDKRFWELLDEAEKANGDNVGIVGWCREIKSKVDWIGAWVEDYEQMPFWEEGIIIETSMKGDQTLSKGAETFLWDTIMPKAKDMEFNYSELERGVISQKRMMWGIQRIKDERFEKRMKLRDEVEKLKVMAQEFLKIYVEDGRNLTITFGPTPPLEIIFKQLYTIAIMSAEQDALGSALGDMGDESERLQLPHQKKKTTKQTKPKKPPKKGGQVIPFRID